LNSNSKFFSRSGFQKLTLRFAKTASRVEVSENEGNDSGAMNTEFLLSLGDKVGRLWKFVIIVLTYKITAEKDENQCTC
jgi:hypothetical protein